MIFIFLPLILVGQNENPDLSKLSRFIESQNYYRAATFADSLFQSGSGDYEAFYLAGIANSRLNRFGRAAEYLRKADSIQPGSRQVMSNLAECYAETARPAEAENLLHRLISQDSTDPAPFIALSGLMVRQGRVEEAMKTYGRLWEADSTNLWYPRQISALLIRSENYRTAIPLLEQITEADSSDIESYLRLGQACININLTNRIPLLDKAIRQDSTNPFLYRYRGGLFLADGFPSKAENDLLKAALLGDSSAFTLRHLGLARFQLSKYELALIDFHETLVIDSTDVQALYYLAFCHKWTQNIPEAIRCMEKAAKMAIPPFTAGIFAGLGQFYSLSRDFPTALRNYEKALEFNPEDPVPHAQIGLLIEESFGDRTVAKDHYEQFLRSYRGPDLNLIRYVEGRIQAINERLFMEGKLKKN